MDAKWLNYSPRMELPTYRLCETGITRPGWSCPPPGFVVKLNVDASFYHDLFVSRKEGSSQGEQKKKNRLVCRRTSVNSNSSPVWSALRQSAECNRITVSGDMLVIQAMVDSGQSASPAAAI
jgi:hypothetical protein